MIRITSKRHNFRRCGVAHPKGPVDYSIDKFSGEELDILDAEPMLTVELIKDQPPAPVGSQKAVGKKKAKRSSNSQ